MERNTNSDSTTRRQFLKTVGGAAAGLLAAGLSTRPTTAQAEARVIGANDRILIGHIGVGGMGMAHVRSLKSQREAVNAQGIAVCDIWEKRKKDAQAELELPDNAVYHDYRKLLESGEIDVVVIASPEHWHAQMALDAMQAGKDVYLEKPMTRHLDDAIKVYRTAQQTGRIVQVGSQGCTDEKWHIAGEMVKAGKIGKVVWCQGSYCRNNPDGEWNYPIDESATPDNLDWKAWLGSAPDCPFSLERYFRWRKYWDYSGGILTDLFPHRLHPLFIAIGGGDFPTRVVCVGGNVIHKDDREVPDVTHLMADFPGGYSMVIAGTTENEQGLQDVVRGNKASLYCGGDTVQLQPERPYADEVDSEEKKRTGPGEDISAHESNFLECVRTRKAPNCNLDLALKVQVTVSLAERSYRENKVMRFDAEKMEVIAG
jgi:predicted dehydrogenase